VAGDSEGFDEAEFADNVQRNLERGRAVIAVVGDGIREGVISLTDLVQSHAGHRFTFALVELALYETPSAGVRLVVPSVLAQTKLIERGVVRIEGDVPAGLRVTVEPPSSPSKASSGRRMGIGEDEFFELLAQKDPGMPDVLKAFLTKADAFGVYADFQGGLNLKHASPTGPPLNMGAIARNGAVDTGFSKYFGRVSQGKSYNETLAKVIGGSVIDAKSEKYSLRAKSGKMPQLSDFLPQHEHAWLDAMEQYIRECLAAAPAGQEP
jgi:hypothetical protein